MSALEQIVDLFDLIGIKVMLEGITKPLADETTVALAEIGIEADVKFDIEVKSVNLDTFREKRNSYEKD